MLQDERKPPRSWPLIAQEMACETDPARLAELAEELKCALDQQTYSGQVVKKRSA
jgi:hypothetical protein